MVSRALRRHIIDQTVNNLLVDPSHLSQVKSRSNGTTERRVIFAKALLATSIATVTFEATVI
jgi:hypothetical protein